MNEVTEEEFMNMSDEERIKYLMGDDFNPEEMILKEMHLQEDDLSLDPEESNEMFSHMFPTDWMKEEVNINTQMGREMISLHKDSYYEDIKRLNALLWKVMMNLDMDSILKEYDESKLDDVLYTFIDEAKYYVIENSFHKDPKVDKDMIKRLVLSAKLHDLCQIYETLYRTAKIIHTMKGKINNEDN